MKSALWWLGLLVVFVELPVEFMVLRAGLSSGDRSQAMVAVYVVAPAVFLNIALGAGVLVWVIQRLTGSSRPGPATNVERSLRYMAISGGVVVVIVTILLGLTFPLGALVYAVAVAFYLVYTMPSSRRQFGYHTTITLRCTPEVAFALVADPRNWSRYSPDLQILEPIDTPLRVGSVVRQRVTVNARTLDEEDEITVIEPGRKLGMRVVVDGQVRHASTYEFRPADPGTEISFRSELFESVGVSLFGGALRRGEVLNLLRSRREKTMLRMKEILEAQPAATV